MPNDVLSVNRHSLLFLEYSFKNSFVMGGWELLSFTSSPLIASFDTVSPNDLREKKCSIFPLVLIFPPAFEAALVE